MCYVQQEAGDDDDYIFCKFFDDPTMHSVISFSVFSILLVYLYLQEIFYCILCLCMFLWKWWINLIQFIHSDEMLQKIQEAGFEVCLQKMVQLTEEQAKDFYKEQEGTAHFEDLIREMTR